MGRNYQGKGIKEEDLEDYINNPLNDRKCRVCNNIRSIKSFTKKKEKNDLYYIAYKCNNCQYKTKLEKYGNRVDLYTATQRNKELNTIEGRARLLRNRCKQRAKVRNMEYSLTINKVIELLRPLKCKITNIKLELGEFNYNPYAPSIDRIDNSLGYTDDNIQIVCVIYNFCKNEFTDKQVKKFITDARV